MAPVEQCSHSIKDVSLTPPSHPEASRLELGKRLREDIAKTADPNGYSLPYDVMLSNKI